MTFLPAPILGGISMLMFVLNLSIWIIPFYFFALLKLLIPIPVVRDWCFYSLENIGEWWIYCNEQMAKILKIDIDIRGVEGLDYNDWYLISSNHQSWNDVFFIQVALNKRIPFPRFFVKQQLIWVPLLGLAWWALELPFMKRHSKAQIAANPSLRADDLETTRIACRKLRERPSTIVNFLEGTRFSPAKHKKQKSPYEHLLRPKAGGLAFTLAALGERMKNYLDVTIVYPHNFSFWDFMCGRLRRVIIDVKQQVLPDWMFAGDYLNDPAFRKRFQSWVNENWQAKDDELKRLIALLHSNKPLNSTN